MQVREELVIRYALEAPSGKRYNIHPEVITRGGHRIRPAAITGDYLAVSAGFAHEIRWKVLNELTGLEGEIAVELTAAEVPGAWASTARMKDVGGGPSNAFLSMILPGLGDVFVNDPGKKVAVKPVYIMAGYVSSVALAWYAHGQSKENYEAYQRAVQQYEMDNYYEQAMWYKDNAQFYTFLAGAIWVCDVARVAIKGGMNKKSSGSTAESRLHIHGGIENGQPQLALNYRF